MDPKHIVLIVDDETFVESLQTYLEKCLEEEKFLVLMYRNGREAQDAIQNGWSYHVGIFDLSLPGIGGDELIQLSKKLHPEVPVICLSNYDFIDDKGGREADSYCTKNRTLQELEAVITRLLENRAQPSTKRLN